MKRARRLTAWWHDRPLRVRVTAGVLAVALVALVAAGAAAEYFLRTFLVDRLDQQIAQVSTVANNRAVYVPDGTLLVVIEPDGSYNGTVTRLGSQISGGGQTGLSPNDIQQLESGAGAFDASLSRLGDYRVHTLSSIGGQTVVGLPLTGVEQTIRRLLILEACAFGSALLLLGVAGAWFVRREMLPLERVAGAARRVAGLPLETGAVALDERVPVDSPGTEVGQVGSAFNAMLGHVEAAFAARSASEERLRRFVADASHELRTPLASIRGYAELFRLPGVPEEDRTRAIGRVESEAIRMGGLVDDLLLLARLDAAANDAAGSRPLVREPLDVALLAADAAGDLRAAEPGRPVTLDLPEGLDDAPLVVLGDEGRLRQVLANLTGNARAHTPAGTAVAVRAIRDGDDIVLGVEDAGPGIPESLLPHVFSRFTRADASRTRDTGGSGLGLSIVQALVQAHGGTVRVDSRPGRTMILVRLPAADPGDGVRSGDVRSGDVRSGDVRSGDVRSGDVRSGDGDLTAVPTALETSGLQPQ